MVKWWTAAICIFSASAATAVEAASPIDLGAAAKSWAPQFVLTGTKTEPTYIEHIRLERDGDLFVLQGGAPAGMPPVRESMVIDAGRIVETHRMSSGNALRQYRAAERFSRLGCDRRRDRPRAAIGIFSSLFVRIIPSRLRLRREVGCTRGDTRSVHRNPERRRDGVAPPDVREIRGTKPRSMVDQHINSKIRFCILR